MNRKLKIGGAGRSGITVVHEGDQPVAIFLPAGAGTDPQDFVKAIKDRDAARAAEAAKRAEEALAAAEAVVPTAPDWDIRNRYEVGAKVAHGGKVWEATRIVRTGGPQPGFIPYNSAMGIDLSQHRDGTCLVKDADTTGAIPTWREVVADAIETPGQAEASAERGIYPAFEVGMLVKRGDRVVHEGSVWECTSHSRDQAGPVSREGVPGNTYPGDESLWRKIGPAEATAEPLKVSAGEAIRAGLDKALGSSKLTGGLSGLLSAIFGEDISLDGDDGVDPEVDAAIEAMVAHTKEYGLKTVGLPWYTNMVYPVGRVVIHDGKAWLSWAETRAIGDVPGLDLLDRENPWLDITGMPTAHEGDDDCTLCDIARKLQGLLGATPEPEGKPDADDCDCGACMLRRHYFTAEGLPKTGSRRSVVMQGLDMLRRKGSDDREVEETARRVVASMVIGAEAPGSEHVVAVNVPVGMDMDALQAAVAIKLKGTAYDLQEVTTTDPR